MLNYCHQKADLYQAEFHYFQRITLSKGMEMFSSKHYSRQLIVIFSTNFSFMTGTVGVLGIFFGIYIS